MVSGFSVVVSWQRQVTEITKDPAPITHVRLISHGSMPNRSPPSLNTRRILQLASDTPQVFLGVVAVLRHCAAKVRIWNACILHLGVSDEAKTSTSPTSPDKGNYGNSSSYSSIIWGLGFIGR